MDIKGDETFLDEGSKAVLHIESLGQVVYAFINGKLAGINFTLSSHKQLKFSLAQSFLTVSMIFIALHNFAVTGSGHGKQKISLDIPINLVAGKNTVDLLSVTVGLAVCSIHFSSAKHCLFG